MRKKLPQILGVVLLLAVLSLISAPVLAQTYAFTLDQEIVHAYWESDGTLSLAYEFVFSNANYADPIDYVDVGMPNGNYSLSNAQPTVNGNRSSISPIPPMSPMGLSLALAETPSNPATRVPLLSRSPASAMCSTRIPTIKTTPVRYSPPPGSTQNFVSGTTDLSISFHLPPGVTTEEPRWHQPAAGFPETPYTELDADGRVTYTWRNQNANGHSQYLFGASFPASYVPASAISVPTFWQNIGIDPDDLFGWVCMCLIRLYVHRHPRPLYPQCPEAQDEIPSAQIGDRRTRYQARPDRSGSWHPCSNSRWTR